MKLRKYFNSKNFSKILAFLILLNGIHTNSFANLLSNDSRYETFEGNSITINDVLEEDKVDIEIEGNTLVNLVDKMPNKTHSYYTIDENYITILDNDIDHRQNYYTLSSGQLDLIKPSTTYTIIAEITKNTLQNEFLLVNNYQASNGDITADGVKIPVGFTGKFIGKFNTLDSFNDRSRLGFSAGFGNRGEITLKNNFIILEGDYTNKDIPPYFKGLKSVGEDDGNIEIVSENKNLLDINNLHLMNYSYDLPFEEKNINTIFNVNGDTINYSTSRWNLGVGGIYKAKKNTKYTAKYEKAICDKNYDMSINIIGLYENELGVEYWKAENYQNYISRLKTIKKAPSEQNVSIIYDSRDYDYLVFYIGGNWKSNPTEIRNITLKNVGIYEADNSDIKYEKYNFKKKNISLSEPLRGLPNGVKDRIIKRNGQWVIERNCGFIDGVENFTKNNILGSTSGSRFKLQLSNIFQKELTKQADVLCDKIPTGKNNQFSFGTEGFYITNDETNLLLIRLKEDLSLEEFKNKFKDIKIVYRLATPIYEPINIDLNTKLYLDTTYISTNSTIPANLKVTVDRVANRAKEYSELAKSNPTPENIALARMWANLMKESILKDEFQSGINNIITIDNLSLEKKSSSSNMDLYIKSKNSLIMSLNTNSIIFEDFSGVEDDIKENAVKISVSSSLPYQLNAYLATGIQNSDSSNTINKLILNIKENGQTEYKTFNALNDKVVLKDGCESGNNNQHNIDLKLNAGIAHEKDAYKTTIQFEAEQI